MKDERSLSDVLEFELSLQDSEMLVDRDFNSLRDLNSKLNDHTILNSSFSNIQLYNVEIENTKFFNAQFHFCDFKDVVFKSCFFRDVQWDKNIFERVTFENCFFENCSFLGEHRLSEKRYLKFIRCFLDNVDFSKQAFEAEYRSWISSSVMANLTIVKGSLDYFSNHVVEGQIKQSSTNAPKTAPGLVKEPAPKESASPKPVVKEEKLEKLSTDAPKRPKKGRFGGIEF